MNLNRFNLNKETIQNCNYWKEVVDFKSKKAKELGKSDLKT